MSIAKASEHEVFGSDGAAGLASESVHQGRIGQQNYHMKSCNLQGVSVTRMHRAQEDICTKGNIKYAQPIGLCRRLPQCSSIAFRSSVKCVAIGMLGQFFYNVLLAATATVEVQDVITKPGGIN